jgi:type IX secretion system PorP/SprF family membrane protein
MYKLLPFLLLKQQFVEKKYILFFSMIFLLPPFLWAQQEAMYTHYMDNTLEINPAYAGSRDALTITGLHRSQWVGFDGAPTTQTLTLHSPVYSDAVNLGLSFVHDRIGPVNNTSMFVDYAFRVKLDSESKLAFGLKLGFNYYDFNLSELSLTNQVDGAFNVNASTFAPNIGFGIYYSRDNFYAGLSTPKIVNNNYLYSETSNSSTLSTEQRHYYLILGGWMPISNDVKIKPSTFVKVTQGAPIEADFTADFLFHDRFSLGAMYRTGDALGFLVGYYVTEQFSIGYSFDWSFVNNTAKYNAGSHEIVLKYDFVNKNQRRIRSPRYFCTF